MYIHVQMDHFCCRSTPAGFNSNYRVIVTQGRGDGVFAKVGVIQHVVDPESHFARGTDLSRDLENVERRLYENPGCIAEHVISSLEEGEF